MDTQIEAIFKCSAEPLNLTRWRARGDSVRRTRTHPTFKRRDDLLCFSSPFEYEGGG